MRYSNFWLLLKNLSSLSSHTELIGEPEFIVRLFQELIDGDHEPISLYAIDEVLSNPYIWSQNSLFDEQKRSPSGPVVFFGSMSSKEQKELLARLPKQRFCLLISEKKRINDWDSCYYKAPDWAQFSFWTQKITAQQATEEDFYSLVAEPWALFDYWLQLRLLGAPCLENSSFALSTDAWKKFGQIRQSPHRASVVSSQDWHQILYCCEMIQQRALSSSSDKFYIPATSINNKLFDDASKKQQVSTLLLPAYQDMAQACLSHNTEDFLWALSRWFFYEDLILKGHTEHESVPS